MNNLYYIENRGCDDTTRGLAIIPDELWDIFKTTIENLNENSSYCYMPKIAVYKIDETMIRETIETDEEYDTLYLNGNTYVVNEYIPLNTRVI